MGKFFICLSFLVICSSIYAQSFSLRQSLKDKNNIENPAIFQITDPENGDRTYQVDAGLSWLFFASSGENSQWEYGLGGEYHRNTVAAEEVNTTAVGLTIEGIIGDITDDGKTSWLPGFSAKYKNDKIKGIESVLASYSKS